MRTTDPFEHDDAAYVLGALSEQEHGAFEAHLVTCVACTVRVNTAGAVATLLTDITAEDRAEPDTLLPGLVRRSAASEGTARRSCGCGASHWSRAGRF